MTQSSTPPTTAPWPAEADLDAQIQRVEQRLIDREARLRHGAAGLARDARRALRPRRLVMPVASAMFGLAALLSLRRRPRGAPASPGPEAPGAGLRLPWTQLVGMAWPLLPARWRDRMGPAAATSLLTLGLPLIEQLAGSRASGPPLAAVPAVDLARVTGRWFLVGELGSPLQPPATEPPELGLLPRDDGQFELLMRRIDPRGTHGSEARVEPLPGSHGARWRVSHWPQALHGLSWAWHELAVLEADDAGEALLLGSPSRDILWLLSRRPELDEARRAATVQIARDQGFEARRLRFFA